MKAIRIAMRLLLALALVLSLLPLTPATPAEAATAPIYVNDDAPGANNGTSWVDAFVDLQSALEVAVAGDTILVAEGTYYPTNTSDRTATFQLKEGVAIYGGYPNGGGESPDWTYYTTTLSGDIGTPYDTDNSYHVVTAGAGLTAAAVLDGFVIEDGNADGASPNSFGGGMWLHQGSPTLANLEFLGNYAAGGGGAGLYVSPCDAGGINCVQTSPTLVDVEFAENQILTAYYTGDGAGMKIDGLSGDNALTAPSLTRVRFVTNIATAGGGLYVLNAAPTGTDLEFDANTAVTSGGGMATSASTVSFGDVRIKGNYAQFGGGVACDSGDLRLVGVVFETNSASDGGGGANVSGGHATFVNALFVGESGYPTGSLGGGGLRVYGGTARADVVNATFYNNDASGGGSNIHVEGAGAILNVRNSIVDGYYDGIAVYVSDTAEARFASSLLEDGCPTGATSCTGVIVSEPGFLDYSYPEGKDYEYGTADDGLSLMYATPEMNGGDNSWVPAGVTTDLLGNARVSGGTVDMGAYEYQIPDPSTLCVDQNPTGTDLCWSSAYTNLQSALDAAVPGDTILVAAGTYYPTVPTIEGDGRSVTFLLKNGVAVYGGYPSGGGDRAWKDNPTTLSGDIGVGGDASDNAYHVVSVWGATGATVLDGFTISGGNAIYSGDTGGGVNIGDASPSLANLIISDNYATWAGGGLYNGEDSLTLSNVEFRNNRASEGGGLFHNGEVLTLSNAEFHGNSAGSRGGGLYAADTVHLSNVVFDGNSTGTSGAGGGMVIDYYSGSAFAATLTNVLFRDNQSLFAAGLYVDGSGASATLTNVTFNRNAATNDAGALAATLGATVNLVNSVLWGDTGPAGSAEIHLRDGGTANVSHSLVQGSGGSGAGWVYDLGTDLGGNLDADPLFTADLHLNLGSPAIDAGDTSAVPSGVTTDLAGNTRVWGGTVDMGAYEGQFADTAPTVTVDPDNQTVGSGDTATFTAAASGYPVPTVKWQEKTASTDWTDIVGATATTYSFTAALTDDGKQYRAVFNNGVVPAGSATADVPTAAATLSVFEQSAPQFTSTSTATFGVGVAGTTFDVVASGVPAPTITITSGSLPTGLTLSATSKAGNTGTATISGTPAAGTAGSRTITFKAANGITPDATQTFTLVVNQAPSISSGSSTTFTVGSPGSFMVSASGYPAPDITHTAGSLPAGISLGPTTYDTTSSTATLGGTPAVGDGGQYSVTFRATNTVLPDADQPFTLTVNERPSVKIQPTDQSASVGGTATFTADAQGWPNPAAQWQVSTNGGKSWKDLAGETGYSLTLTGIDLSMGGNQYQAVFSNALGSATSSAATLTVTSGTNNPPVINSVTNDGPINENTLTPVTVWATDADFDTLVYSFDCDNDDTFEIGPQDNQRANCAFLDNGSYTVGVKVADGKGGEDTSSTTVTVNNVAPTVNAGDDATIDVGGSFIGSGSFTDPGDDSWAATVDYGDGSGVQQLPFDSFFKSFTLDHDYDTAGIYTVTVRVTETDVEAAWGVGTVQVTVGTVQPDLWVNKEHTGDFTQSQTGATYSITVGNNGAGPTSGIVTVADTLPAGLTATAVAGEGWTCDIDTLTCTRSDVLPGTGTQISSIGASAISAVPTYAPIILTVDVAADASSSVTNTATVSGGGDTNTANNSYSDVTTITAALVAPEVSTQPTNQTVMEGQTVEFTAAASGNPTPTVQWQSLPVGGSWSNVEGATSVVLAFTAQLTDNGTQFRAVFTNSVDSVTSDAATLTVTATPANSVPVVNAGPDAGINEGSTFTGSGFFTDPNVDNWTATVDYGDGAGSQTLALNPDKTFALSHVYAATGSYTVTVTVNDGTATGTDTVTVTVAPASVGRADLVISIKDAPDPVKQGDEVIYTIVVTNKGPQEAVNVVMSAPLPGDTELRKFSSRDGWSCAVDAGTLSCGKASMAVKEAATFAVELVVRAGPGSAITFNASVTSATNDPKLDNNSVSATTTVVADVPKPGKPKK